MSPGELRCWLAHLGLGGLDRTDGPDPLDVGSGPVPRLAVRLVALEAALWEGGREAPPATELADEAGLKLSTRRPGARGPRRPDGGVRGVAAVVGGRASTGA